MKRKKRITQGRFIGIKKLSLLYFCRFVFFVSTRHSRMHAIRMRGKKDSNALFIYSTGIRDLSKWKRMHLVIFCKNDSPEAGGYDC